MSGPAVVSVKRNIGAPIGRVFDAWLDPGEAMHFLFATEGGKIVRCDIDARLDGRFLITDRRSDGDAEHHGQFIEIDRPRRIVFLFRGPGTKEGEWSKVSVDFAQTENGCALSLTHEVPARWAAYREPVRSGWSMILGTLANYMEKRNG